MLDKIKKYISNPFGKLGMGICLSVGLVLGFAFDNIAIGIGLGMFCWGLVKCQNLKSMK